MSSDAKYLLYTLAAFVLIIAVYASSPMVSQALSTPTSGSADLSETIRAALLKDPRAASMPPAQLNAMVSLLAEQAQSQGMTAQDIAYRPNMSGYYLGPVAPPASGCTDISSPLCPLGQALGFDTPNKSVAVGLWATSGLLMATIWFMRRNPHIRAAHGMDESSAAI